MAAWAPEAPLLEVDGVPVLLSALVSTPTSVVIHLYAAPNEVTDALEAAHASALAAWSSQGGRKLGWAPDPPDLSLFREIDLLLTDDVGTPYRQVGRQWTATARWETVRRFRPALPKQASSVTVAIDTERGRGRPCVLALR